MKLSWKKESLPLGLITLMFGLAAWQWPTAPDRIPVHWDLQGQVNGWGGKFMGLLLLPILALGLELLFLVLPRLDPKGGDGERYGVAYDIIRNSLVAFMAAIYLFTLLVMRGVDIPAGTVFPILIGALMTVFGAVMGKLRSNWFAGIRTPWTLSSQLSWGKTNRLAGWIFLATGLATIATAFLGQGVALRILFTGILGGSLLCIVYSYFVWKDDPDKAGLSDPGSQRGAKL